MDICTWVLIFWLILEIGVKNTCAKKKLKLINKMVEGEENYL